MRILVLPFLFLLPAICSTGQNLKVIEEYVRMDASASDPLYTTYAAAMTRSTLYGDIAYKMDYYSDCKPVTYSSDLAGSMYCIWKVDDVVVRNIGEYLEKPVVQFSFPDMAILRYRPFRDIVVKETFFVYNSATALVEMEVINQGRIPHEVVVYPILEPDEAPFEIISYDSVLFSYLLKHPSDPYRLISSLKPEYGYPTLYRDLFTVGHLPDSYGGYQGNADRFYTTMKTDYYSTNRLDLLNYKNSDFVDFIAFQLKERLRPGERVVFRYFRQMEPFQESLQPSNEELENIRSMHLKTYFEDNLILFSRIPRISFNTIEEKILYLSSFNLIRSSMYPPSGKTTHNYYAFSRNPIWGWGHGHQVLHESLVMLAYGYMDPSSAQSSQRVYMEQQRADGLIAYRHGPRGLQDYPHKGMSTTSAPFYNWINWELWLTGKDSRFLEDAYISGSAYLNWIRGNRDVDQDGTFEWGPYGLIENVRDWYNAVYQVSAERYLDVDKEDISDELECLDLSLMVVKEAGSLASMAEVLNKPEESKAWKDLANSTAKLINDRMWDDSSGFYYAVNRDDHGWFYLTRDLRKQEIIGFLPMWAGVASPERAEKLISVLTDTTRFWRRYGIPTLSARDPWYNPNVDYCCKWNGPVWLLWNYMVYEGLRNYGYDSLAHQLAGKMVDCVVTQLKKNHNFWESYSPDNEVLNCPSNYIWDAIIARVLIEEYRKRP